MQQKEIEIIYNRKVRYNYEVIETFDAGIKLAGLEVKAIRGRLITISEAWVKIDNSNRVWVVEVSINPSKVSEWQKYSPVHDRELLLRKTETKKLKSLTLKGLTIVPLRVFFNERGFAKVTIAVVKGKKMFDKRQQIKDRDSRRKGD